MTAEPLRHGEATIPRPLLIAAAAMLAASVIGAALGRGLDIGRDLAAAPPQEMPAASRDMRFIDQDDGGIDVIDATTGLAFARFAPGEDGFARATLRGLVRDRKKLGLGPETPFRLTLRRDGGLALDDPATGRHVDLRAFGATNRDAFARLLPRTGETSAGDRR
jgi:putative photosynthetic complex assembly protein